MIRMMHEHTIISLQTNLQFFFFGFVYVIYVTVCNVDSMVYDETS